MSIKLFEDREDDAEVDEDGGGCDGEDDFMSCKCPKFEVIANLEVESVVNTFAVIIHLKLSHYGNDRLRKRV